MILLITDNTELANSFRNDLHQEGFGVDLLKDHNQVFTKLYQNPDYHMVIFDLESTKNDTSKLFEKLKKDPKLKYIPLICIVQKNMVVEQLIAFELGADEFIYVPYTTPELQLKMRAIQRLLDLQNQLKEKENQLNALKQVQRILVTLSHYINNSLTPLYTMVQMMNENNPDDAQRLKEFVTRTVEFINKVLRTLNNLVQSGEMKVVQQGVYKDLMLDIEKELKSLQDSGMK